MEENFANNEFAEYEISFSSLKDINWKTDGPTLISSLLNIYRSYLSLDAKDLDVKVLLDNEKLPEFINTLLSGIDFSTSIIESIKVTEKGLEGIKVNSFQAIDLARLLGIEIIE